MKVGILTFHDAHNYGAVLQAYALKKYIKKLGFDTKIINYHHFTIPEGFPRERENETNYSYADHIKRWDKFNQFIKELIDNEEKVYTTEEELEKLDIDFWICGSDQIWNTDITGGINRGFFLDFKTKGKKISYAVSMGIPELPKEQEEQFKNCINGIDNISVREETLKKYAEKFTNKPITQVVDPTLLLEENEYQELIEESKLNNYLLIYALGPDDRLTQIAKKVAEKENLKIIEINDFKKENYFCEQISDAGPKDFLTLIKNAKAIVTNSFHGTLFSILFEKEFYTITRNNRNSRMESLLDIVNMRDRLIQNVDEIEKVKEQDYKKAYISLQKEIDTKYPQKSE